MRINKLLLIMMVSLLALGGCQNDDASSNQLIHASATGDGKIPVLWVYESESLYQPTFGNLTQKGFENFSKEKIQMDASGLSFTFTTEDTSTWIGKDPVDVSIYNKKNEMIFTSQVIPDNGLYHIATGENINLLLGDTYYIDIETMGKDTKVHYYLPFLYVEKSQNRLGISYVHEELEKFNTTAGIMPMGIEQLRIESNQDQQMYIQVNYVGAKREDTGFHSLDVVKKFAVDYETMTLEALESSVQEKQRYYYSSEHGGWYLGAFGERENRQIIKSPNNRFEVIYNSNEAYLYDTQVEMMYEVYRLDRLNSDYIYDESIEHGIEIFEVSNKGEVHFLVYGYIQDASPNYGRSGIAFYRYDMQEEPILYSLGMIENPEDYRKMATKLNEMFYYNSQERMLYILYEQSLYRLDFDVQEFSYVETFIKGKLDGDNGLIYWDDNMDKYTNTIHIVDLSGRELHYTNLFELGSYKHLLDVIEGQIFVGEYAIEDTYEYLNGNVVFPYHTINQYNQQGDRIKTYDASDYGQGYYFSDIYLDDTENKYKVDIMTMHVAKAESYRNSRVHFMDVEEYVYLDFPVKNGQERLESPVIVSSKVREAAMVHAVSVSTSYKDNDYFQFRKMPPLDVYVVSDHIKGTQYYTINLDEAFIYGQNKKDYTIYHWKYNVKNNSGELTEIFNNKDLREQVYLDDIIIIPQRPELPRGCEVTALSILLNRYVDDAPSKLTLNAQVKTSPDNYEIKNGFVHFADMHLEFSGSASDTSKPGLGVYIKPIQELAEKYVSNRAKAVSGISFEQLLGLVANDMPVLIITPNRYQEVQDHSKQVWKTPSGYMEVTYQEHSVVVMGFDEKHVYYSDPSKARIDKKPKEDFRRGWESMGSQAMIIVD